jgi:hypothetical protein
MVYVGFTANDESIILYDQFDIWQFEINSAYAKKLTFSGENEQIFRIVDIDKDRKDGFCIQEPSS